MTKIDELMQRQYAYVVTPDEATDGTMLYVAKHPDLPGCMSQGDTPEEALENLREARRLYFETLLEMNLEIPDPRGMGFSASMGTAIGVILKVFPGNIKPLETDETFQVIERNFSRV